MRLKRSKLRDAIAFSLAVSATALAGSGVALAQETEQPQAQTATSLDTVTVTGSRIKSQTFTASSPITEITAEEFTQCVRGAASAAGERGRGSGRP